MIGTLLQGLSLFSVVVFTGYVATIVMPYLRRRPDVPGDSTAYQWHIFVPARDEEAVIEPTIRRLLEFPAAHVWVIDDDSEDRTAGIVRTLSADPRVHLVQRRRPEARTGKGDALNAAYSALSTWLPVDSDRTRVIVGVVDADGALADDVLDLVAGPRVFGDPDVGGVQISVRMSNRHTRGDGVASSALGGWFARFLVRMQDLEFVGTISAMQMLREKTGTVGLGGNGQFSRLSVLDVLRDDGDGTPWHGALLEDYELGLHILLAGYKNRFVFAAEVYQEAVESGRRLIAQRARWAQGGMQCSRLYLGRILQSRHLSSAGALESAYFLVAPWTQLFGVLYWPTMYALLFVKCLTYTAGPLAFAADYWFLAVLTAVTGIAPFAVWGPLYRRVADPGMGRFRAVWLGLEYAIFLTYTYPTTARAFGRLVTGRSGWAKTRRNAEPVRSGPVAVDA